MLAEQLQDILPLLAAEIQATEATITHYRAQGLVVPPKTATNRLSRREVVNHKRLQEVALRQAVTRLSYLHQLRSIVCLVGAVRCTYCQEVISIRRLRLFPQTRLCEPCAH